MLGPAKRWKTSGSSSQQKSLHKHKQIVYLQLQGFGQSPSYMIYVGAWTAPQLLCKTPEIRYICLGLQAVSFFGTFFPLPVLGVSKSSKLNMLLVESKWSWSFYGFIPFHWTFCCRFFVPRLQPQGTPFNSHLGWNRPTYPSTDQC